MGGKSIGSSPPGRLGKADGEVEGLSDARSPRAASDTGEVLAEVEGIGKAEAGADAEGIAEADADAEAVAVVVGKANGAEDSDATALAEADGFGDSAAGVAGNANGAEDSDATALTEADADAEAGTDGMDELQMHSPLVKLPCGITAGARSTVGYVASSSAATMTASASRVKAAGKRRMATMMAGSRVKRKWVTMSSSSTECTSSSTGGVTGCGDACKSRGCFVLSLQ